MKNISKILLILAILVIAVVAIVSFSKPRKAQIEILGEQVNLLIANNLLEQKKGLSNTQVASLGADGMLFVFADKQQRTFWMNQMNYNLDVLWIADNKIMKIDRNVPAPKSGEEPAKMYSRPFEVNMVIELPAGGVDKFGFVEGQVVEIEK